MAPGGRSLTDRHMDRPTNAKELASEDGMDPMDRISRLPDEIIAHILSLLTLRKALTTSLLSKRWRYLWISHATCLDFCSGWDISTAQFVELVDGVLQQYNRSGDRGRSLHRFSVSCEIGAERKSCVGRWLKFALSKQVKELELHLWCFDGHLWGFDSGIDRPRLREHLLSSDIIADADVIGETWPQNSGDISPGYQSYGSSWTVGLGYLKHLVLSCVSIQGEFIDYLLANCSVLERLALIGCHVSKKKFMVSEQSLKLKALHIRSCCPDFTHIEIYNMSLVYLTYRGNTVPRLVGSIPQLVELCIGWTLPLPQDTIFDGLFSNSISHVQILKLEFYNVRGMDMLKLPQLRNVIQLEITLTGIGHGSLLPSTRIAEACPNLQKFMLKMLWWWETLIVKKEEIQRSIVRHPLEHLELVEFHGPYDTSSHYELVQYFIKYAVAFRKLVVKIVVDTDCAHAERILERLSASRECAKQQLEGNLPSKIELVII